jgi:signal transduction histidine kinase
VVKHAHAKNISIQVNRFGDRINVIVEDDGVGFDVAKIREKPGLGMQNLAARVHDLGGELQIDSRPGHGTTVSIDIPLKS